MTGAGVSEKSGVTGRAGGVRGFKGMGNCRRAR